MKDDINTIAGASGITSMITRSKQAIKQQNYGEQAHSIKRLYA